MSKVTLPEVAELILALRNRTSELRLSKDRCLICLLNRIISYCSLANWPRQNRGPIWRKKIYDKRDTWRRKGWDLWTRLLQKSSVHSDIIPRIREAECPLGPRRARLFSHWLMTDSFPCKYLLSSISIQRCSLASAREVTALPRNKNCNALIFP